MTTEKGTRPRYFAERISVESATVWIDAHTHTLGQEEVSLDNAVGRVLAADVAAAIDVPHFDRAAADGYALRASETVGAGTYNPMIFQLVKPPDAAAPLAGPGIAVRVAAGAPMPAGADAIVSRELAQETRDGFVEIIDAVTPADNVERRGTHIRRGASILAAGRQVGPVDIGALASTGLARLSVVRRPRVRLVSVGHNPVIKTQESESVLPLSLIPDSDGPLLRALVTRDGGTIAGERRIERGRAAICEAISATADADVILVTGGTGFGSNDEAAAALAEIGELAMYGLALRPGGSAGIGRVGTALVLLLPGAPSSCLWAYEVLAGRAVRRLGGRDARLPHAVRSFAAARKIVSAIGFTQICPVRRLGNDRVEPIASFDEAGLFAATMADGFVIISEGSEGFAQGATVEVYLLASGDVSQDPMVG